MQMAMHMQMQLAQRFTQQQALVTSGRAPMMMFMPHPSLVSAAAAPACAQQQPGLILPPSPIAAPIMAAAPMSAAPPNSCANDPPPPPPPPVEPAPKPRSRIISFDELTREMTVHHDSEELRRLFDALRTKQIDLRRFCSSVRRLCGIQVLFDTLVGLREGNSRSDDGSEDEVDCAETATAATCRKKTILVHALFCGSAACPLEGCRTIKQLVTPLKAHALRCSAGEECEDCDECGKWRQLQQLKEKYKRKLSGIAKAPLIRRRAGGRCVPGVSRHQLDSVNIAQRILSKSESSYI